MTARDGRAVSEAARRTESRRRDAHRASSSCLRTSPTIWPTDCRALMSSSDLSKSRSRSLSERRTARWGERQCCTERARAYALQRGAHLRVGEREVSVISRGGGGGGGGRARRTLLEVGVELLVLLEFLLIGEQGVQVSMEVG